MDRLRPRQRPLFTGFTRAEIEKLEKLSLESREVPPSKEFCQKIARSFSSSSGRAGKPIVKWTEVQNWFVARQQESALKVPSVTDRSKDDSGIPQTCPVNDGDQYYQILKGLVSKVGEKVPDLSELEFEAKSSKDEAWYDVDTFVSHRCISPSEAVSIQIILPHSLSRLMLSSNWSFSIILLNQQKVLKRSLMFSSDSEY